MKAKVKVAMCQIEVVYGEPEKNLETALKAIDEAVQMGAKICVLPECMDLGWAEVKAHTMAQMIPGERTKLLSDKAKEAGVYIACGLTEREGDKLYNTAVLISDEGEILLKHRKIGLLFDVEGQYSVGDRVNVAHTPYGTIGIDICADNTMNNIHLAHAMGMMGADMILSPCAWAVPEEDLTKPYGATWLVPYELVAKTYGISVIGVSCVGDVASGAWKGWYNIGNSIAMGKDGVIAVLPFGAHESTVKVIEVERK